MKDFIRKHIKALAIFFIVFIVAIPSLINFAFKVSAPIGILSAEWDAGNALAFYGVIVASFSTVAGVYLSIEYSQKNLQADTKKRVQPYLFLSVMNVHNDYDPFLDGLIKASEESTPQKNEDEPIESTGYSEGKLDKVFFVISSAGITAQKNLTEEQRKLLEHRGFRDIKDAMGTIGIHDDLISIPCEVENVGIGAAINIRVGFNRANGEKRYIRPIALKMGQTLYLHIFSINPPENMLGEYELEFQYEDIIGTKYLQKYPISFVRGKNNYINHTINLNSTQQER